MLSFHRPTKIFSATNSLHKTVKCVFNERTYHRPQWLYNIFSLYCCNKSAGKSDSVNYHWNLGSSIMRKKMSISRESPAIQVKEYSDSSYTVIVINLQVIRHSTPFLWLRLTFKTLCHDFVMVSKQSWMY